MMIMSVMLMMMTAIKIVMNNMIYGIQRLFTRRSYVVYCRFNQILCQRSFAHLRAVFDEYAKISKKTVEDAIKSEFSGDIKEGLLTVGTRQDLSFQLNSRCFVL